MHSLKNVFLSLVRPKRGVDGAATALKWLWIPLMALLVGSAVVKATVATPLSIKAMQEEAKAQLEQSMAVAPKEKRATIRETEEEALANAVDDGTTLVSTAAIVFAALGAIGAVLYVATFFFVACKTWACKVSYPVMLSITALSFVPRTLGNLVQTAYMSATDIWLRHAGMGAMVAPADTMDPPGMLYAILSQVDIWVIWGLLILFGALLSKAVGLERKHAITGMLTFIVATGILRAIPTLIAGAFMGLV